MIFYLLVRKNKFLNTKELLNKNFKLTDLGYASYLIRNKICEI